MRPNANFMPQVLNKIPRETKVIVVCQKGLRSLAACEQLSKTGYENIAWLNGGCEAAEKGVSYPSTATRRFVRRWHND
jgi:rhodanese-related sulfurtransferase